MVYGFATGFVISVWVQSLRILGPLNRKLFEVWDHLSQTFSPTQGALAPDIRSTAEAVMEDTVMGSYWFNHDSYPKPTYACMDGWMVAGR